FQGCHQTLPSRARKCRAKVLHACAKPERPWFRVPNWPAHVTGHEMVAAMNKVGVDGAIFISPFSMYKYDGSYAAEVQKAHPDTFAIVQPVDPDQHKGDART